MSLPLTMAALMADRLEVRIHGEQAGWSSHGSRGHGCWLRRLPVTAGGRLPGLFRLCHRGCSEGACQRAGDLGGRGTRVVPGAQNHEPAVIVADNLPGVAAARDSNHPGRPLLAFAPDDWRTFKVAITA